MSKQAKKLSNKEIFWYVLSGVIGVLGLTSLVFGIVGDHFPGLYEDNWIAASENGWIKAWSHLGYRYWGIILIVVAAFIAVVALTVFAKEGDRDTERALRRQQRLAMANAVVESKEDDEKKDA
ncbi:MAG: hypothetical protein E7182_06375 [Erysipelotrichaceae bacterium]|jgi:uncharacterized membrane protein|nr:hypothetical protein [Erysipelotrichaceae bacterium]